MCKIGKNGGTVFHQYRQKLQFDHYKNQDFSSPNIILYVYQILDF